MTRERKVHYTSPGYWTLTACGIPYWMKPETTDNEKKVTCGSCIRFRGLCKES